MQNPQCYDDAYSAGAGGLFGAAVGTLHHVHHALTDQIPENVHAHVFGEIAASALGGATLFAAVSAICNWISRSR